MRITVRVEVKGTMRNLVTRTVVGMVLITVRCTVMGTFKGIVIIIELRVW